MNLNTASPAELENYKAAVCAVLGIDPLMLDYIMMPDPMGYTGTNRVLYAKRGAAEILRKNMGIDVLSLTPYESNGWLMFTVVAKNREGRQEVAVGAAYTHNLTGEKVAHAVMTAQTRAVRRVTLQFVTGGILDESEVQTQAQFSQAPAASSASLAGSPMVVPPPVAAPNNAPGLPVQSTSAEKAAETITIPTASPVESPVKAETQAAENVAEATPEPKKKRTRKPKGQVDIGAPTQPETPAAPVSAPPDPAAEAAKQAQFEAEQAKLREEAQAALRAKPVEVPPAVPAPAPLTPEQTADFKARTRHYANNVLVEGGMLPSDGVGGITMKLRKFSQVHTGATTAVLTAEQNEDLFSFLDGFTKQFGPAALVAYIDKAIGATK